MERQWKRVLLGIVGLAVMLLWAATSSQAGERPGGGMTGSDEQTIPSDKSSHEAGVKGDGTMNMGSTPELGKDTEMQIRNPESAPPAREALERASAFEQLRGFERPLTVPDHDYVLSPP